MKLMKATGNSIFATGLNEAAGRTMVMRLQQMSLLKLWQKPMHSQSRLKLLAAPGRDPQRTSRRGWE